MTLYCQTCGAATTCSAIRPHWCRTCAGPRQFESAEAHYARGHAKLRDYVKLRVRNVFREWLDQDGALHRHASLEPGFIVWTENDREFLRLIGIEP